MNDETAEERNRRLVKQLEQSIKALEDYHRKMDFVIGVPPQMVFEALDYVN